MKIVNIIDVYLHDLKVLTETEELTLYSYTGIVLTTSGFIYCEGISVKKDDNKVIIVDINRRPHPVGSVCQNGNKVELVTIKDILTDKLTYEPVDGEMLESDDKVVTYDLEPPISSVIYSERLAKYHVMWGGIRIDKILILNNIPVKVDRLTYVFIDGKYLVSFIVKDKVVAVGNYDRKIKVQVLNDEPNEGENNETIRTDRTGN